MKHTQNNWHRTVDTKKESHDPEKLLTYSSLSRLLGISERTLFSMVKAGDVPAIRIGKSVRFKPADIERWLIGHTSGGGFDERSE